MHEMSVVMQIIKTVTSAIPKGGKPVRVETVNLRVGGNSCIMPDNLRFCFKMAVENTALDGAELNIEEIPMMARCDACRHEWRIHEPAFACPECSAKTINVLSGRELEIVSVDVADE